jgi:hypothetical protein
VAQSGSALGWGPSGRWFESSRPDSGPLTTDARSANLDWVSLKDLISSIAIAVAVVIAVVALLRSGDGDDDAGFPEAKKAAPDTVPAEFAYLDSGRVLAYIGQVEGGLAATETQTLSAKTTAKGSLTAKDVATAEVSSERLRGSSKTVTLTEADRFYTLLRILRADQGDDDEDGFSTLEDIDVEIDQDNPIEGVRQKLADVEEGDFVRIKNAYVYLPTYAAVLPRARFASRYLGGGLKEPRRALYAPVRPTTRRIFARYRARLHKNPRVPMVLPTLDPERRGVEGAVTFFMPARYRSLSPEASLLRGELTVVGKVVYTEPRLPSEIPSDAPKAYVDFETLTRFAPALKRAEDLLLNRLNMTREGIVEQVRRSLSIDAPVAVIIPVAMYQ